MDTTKLENLLNGYVDGTLSADEKRELERMLLESAEVRELFWRQVQLHCSIRNCYEARSGQQFVNSANRTSIERLEPLPSPISISLGPPGSAWHGTVGYFSSGWPVAYLAATVIFGVGLLIGSLMHVSQPAQVARQSSVCPCRSLPSRRWSCWPDYRHGRLQVGTEVRAHESGPELQVPNPRPKTLVSLGDKFALASGLMEITYDTGAKVISGPGDIRGGIERWRFPVRRQADSEGGEESGTRNAKR